MSGAGSLSADAYGAALDELVAYASEDWLGFTPLVGELRDITGWTVDELSLVPIVLDAVRDLAQRGVRAGDLAASDEEPFVPWPGDVDDALELIKREIEQLGRLPMSGEVCWFHRTG